MKTICLCRVTPTNDVCYIIMNGEDEPIETISALRGVNPAFNPLYPLDKLLEFLIQKRVRAYAMLEDTGLNDPISLPELLMFNKRLEKEGLLLTPKL